MNPLANSPGSAQLGSRELQSALMPYDIAVNETQILQIRTYTSLLLRWNRSISLTAVTNPIEIAARHFGESMFAANVLPVENCRLADLGTGAGFPGLALKIYRPTMKLVLIESNKKKCAFLSEVIRELGLQEVEVRTVRFEETRPEELRCDVITARALGEFKQVLAWSRRSLRERGHLALWVGSEDCAKISAAPRWIWQPPIKIPESQRRFLLVGRPNPSE